MKKIIFSLCLLAIFACNRDEIDGSTECLEEITYTTHIKEIIDKSCAYSGCHLNGTAPGDFGSYSGMESYINSNELSKRMLETRNMPPSYAPSPNPTSLTDEEINLVSCWVQNDYAN